MRLEILAPTETAMGASLHNVSSFVGWLRQPAGLPASSRYRSMRASVLGALTTGAGLVPALIVVSVICGVATLAPLVGRSWKGLDSSQQS